MRIAMIATRFAGLDGVSLETAKVAEALEREGHEIVWFAGELGPEFKPGVEYPPAFFGGDRNLDLEHRAFDAGDPDEVRAEIDEAAAGIADEFDVFLDRYSPDALVIQNAWAIPMQLPLAVALARKAEEHQLPTIAHHHDFSWERERFSSPVVPNLLNSYFPPVGDHIAHVVINQDARDELMRRRDINAVVLPNVMDFEEEALTSDGGDAFRRLAGLDSGTTILLQPTRVIPRKGIELSIELASRLDGEVALVVTHPDDLDEEYWSELEQLADERGVDLRLVDAGRSLDSLASAYAAADLVCFPSVYEGYGNALVETLFFRRPLFVNRYSVYSRDIAPLGVTAIEIDGSVTEQAVRAAQEWIDQSEATLEIVEHNARIGLRNLSYAAAVDAYRKAFATLGIEI
jgi:glycosyltransferase involved in cell wall biosynthesis